MLKNADLGEGFAFNFSLFQPNSHSREWAQSSPHVPGLALPLSSLCLSPGVMLSPDLSILMWGGTGENPAPTLFPHSLIPFTCPRDKEQPKVGIAHLSGSLFSGQLTGCTILEATIVLCQGFAEENLAGGTRWDWGVQAEASLRIFGHSQL